MSSKHKRPQRKTPSGKKKKEKLSSTGEKPETKKKEDEKNQKKKGLYQKNNNKKKTSHGGNQTSDDPIIRSGDLMGVVSVIGEPRVIKQEEIEDPAGEKKVLIAINVVSAKDLHEGDMFGKKSDPYVIIQVNNLEEKRTKTISNDSNPVWNEKFRYKLDSEAIIEFSVFDKDFGKDDAIGKLSVRVEDVVSELSKSKKEEFTKEYSLRDAKKGTLKLTFSCQMPVIDQKVGGEKEETKEESEEKKEVKKEEIVGEKTEETTKVKVEETPENNEETTDIKKEETTEEKKVGTTEVKKEKKEETAEVNIEETAEVKKVETAEVQTAEVKKEETAEEKNEEKTEGTAETAEVKKEDSPKEEIEITEEKKTAEVKEEGTAETKKVETAEVKTVEAGDEKKVEVQDAVAEDPEKKEEQKKEGAKAAVKEDQKEEKIEDAKEVVVVADDSKKGQEIQKDDKPKEEERGVKTSPKGKEVKKDRKAEAISKKGNKKKPISTKKSPTKHSKKHAKGTPKSNKAVPKYMPRKKNSKSGKKHRKKLKNSKQLKRGKKKRVGSSKVEKATAPKENVGKVEVKEQKKEVDVKGEKVEIPHDKPVETKEKVKGTKEGIVEKKKNGKKKKVEVEKKNGAAGEMDPKKKKEEKKEKAEDIPGRTAIKRTSKGSGNRKRKRKKATMVKSEDILLGREQHLMDIDHQLKNIDEEFVRRGGKVRDSKKDEGKRKRKMEEIKIFEALKEVERRKALLHKRRKNGKNSQQGSSSSISEEKTPEENVKRRRRKKRRSKANLQKPLYQKMLDEYNTKMTTMKSEEVKILDDRRKLFKRSDDFRSELNHFQHQYKLKKLKLSQNKIRVKRVPLKTDSSFLKKLYSGNSRKRILFEIEEKRKREVAKIKELKDKLEKRRRYVAPKPRVRRKKSEDDEHGGVKLPSISRNSGKNRFSRKKPGIQESREMAKKTRTLGNSYLQQSKKRTRKSRRVIDVNAKNIDQKYKEKLHKLGNEYFQQSKKYSSPKHRKKKKDFSRMGIDDLKKQIVDFDDELFKNENVLSKDVGGLDEQQKASNLLLKSIQAKLTLLSQSV